MTFKYLQDLCYDIAVFTFDKLYEWRFILYCVVSLHILFVLIGLIIFSYLIYFVIYKIYNHNIARFSIKSNELSQQTKIALFKYGKYKINKVYLIKQPVTNITTELLDCISFCNYSNYFNSINHIIFHATIMFEITYKGRIKFICIDKMPGDIRINDNFKFNPKQSIKQLTMNQDNKVTKINKLFHKTIKRIGLLKALEWNMLDNTCETFTNELLKTLGIPLQKTQQPIVKGLFVNLHSSTFSYLKHFTIFITLKVLNSMNKIVNLNKFMG